jgi:hypothetical protein
MFERSNKSSFLTMLPGANRPGGILRLWLLLLCFLSVTGSMVEAQSYHWQKTYLAEIPCVEFNPLSHGRILFAASPDSIGISRSDDGGFYWQNYRAGLEEFVSTNIGQILCLESDTNVVLAVSTRKAFRSTNGGKNWSVVLDPGGIDGEDLTYHKKTDALYYGQNFQGPVYRSLDHGATWQETGPADTSVGLCALSVSPDDSKVLLAGSLDGVIARSSDEGAHWAPVYPADLATMPEIPKIVYSKYSPQVAIATRWKSNEASIVETTDRGLHWTTLPSPDPHAWAIEIDQHAAMLKNGLPQHLWTGIFLQGGPDSSKGGLVEESFDGGHTWDSTGFPRKPLVGKIWMIKHDTSSGTLAVGTDAGLFIGKIPSGVHTLRSEPNLVLHLSDNPAENTTNISWQGLGANCTMEVQDVLGRVLLRYTLIGKTNFALDTHALPSGWYTVRTTGSNGSIAIGRFIRL